eukprot:358281-Chlamydomonas_euryale.AAC.1
MDADMARINAGARLALVGRLALASGRSAAAVPAMPACIPAAEREREREREGERSLTSSIALSLSQPCGIPHNWVQHACRQNDRSPPRPAPTRRWVDRGRREATLSRHREQWGDAPPRLLMASCSAWGGLEGGRRRRGRRAWTGTPCTTRPA